MKHFQIEDAKTRFFKSKEHYLNFKKEWKAFHNSDKLVWREDVEQYSWAAGKDIVIRNVKHTSLGAQHYMLYNLLRGYASDHGFREDSDNGWAACEYAAWEIWRTAKDMKDVNGEYALNRKSTRARIESLLLPFGDTVSHEMLFQLGKDITVQFYGNNPDTYFDFEVEEWREIEPEKKVSIAERVKSWRTA